VIKLLVKLAIVALLANAAFRVGSEYVTYVKFRDSIREVAMFKAKTDTELMSRILVLANHYEVPVEEENINIQREQQTVNIDGWYDKPIELVPDYEYPWHFTLSIEVTTPGLPHR
jgi:hypothetical protein